MYKADEKCLNRKRAFVSLNDYDYHVKYHDEHTDQLKQMQKKYWQDNKHVLKEKKKTVLRGK